MLYAVVKVKYSGVRGVGAAIREIKPERRKGKFVVPENCLFYKG